MSLKTWLFEDNFPTLSPLSGQGNITTAGMAAAAGQMKATSDYGGFLNVNTRKMVAPSRDEFAAWRADPTTLFLMAALRRNADECADDWHQRSWVHGKADPLELVGL